MLFDEEIVSYEGFPGFGNTPETEEGLNGQIQEDFKNYFLRKRLRRKAAVSRPFGGLSRNVAFVLR